MKFSQTINEGLKFKDFEPGMTVSIKRTPWDEANEYEVDSIDRNINDEVEVTLKHIKNGEEYIIDKNEMNIIEVKEIKRPKKKEVPKEEEKEEKNEELNLMKILKRLK